MFLNYENQQNKSFNVGFQEKFLAERLSTLKSVI
jgi:hypothetical protein